MIAGCSIRHSTPPRISARKKIFVVLQEPARAARALREHEADHPAEAARLLLLQLVLRVLRKPRIDDLLDLRMRSSHSAIARAFVSWRSMRTCSVFVPRSVSNESIGGTAPTAFCRMRAAVQRSCGSSRDPADDVAVAVRVLRRECDDDVGAELERPLKAAS